MLKLGDSAKFFLLFSILFFLAIPVWIENFTTLPFEGTYGSDAYYYYVQAKDSAFEGKDCSLALAPAYVCLASTTLSLMPWFGVVGVNLLLILIYVASIIILAKVTEKFSKIHFRYSVNSARIKLFVYALTLNPIILWTVLRGVKETLVFLVFLLFFISMHMLLKGKIFFSLVTLLISAYVIEMLKPGGSAFVVLPYFICLFFYLYRKGGKARLIATISAITLSILASVILVSYIHQLKAHQALFLGENSNVNLFVAPFRFILGPGVIGSFRQIIFQDVFLVSTRVGDWLIFFGSVAWYLSLICLGYKLLVGFRWFKRNITILIMISSFFIFYIFVYSIAYGGTGDTRHRAVVYFSSIPLMAICFCIRRKRVKSFIN